MTQGCEDAMLNQSAPVMRRHRRIAAAMVAIGVLALLAACSGSPSSAGSGGSPTGGGSANAPSGVSYSQCMRSHGVPNFPDPPSGGGIPKGSAQEFGISNTQYEAAQTACQHLIPATGGSAQQQEQQCFAASDCPPAVVQRLLNVMREFSQCMRSRGVPNFPGPAPIPRASLFLTLAHTVFPTVSHIHRNSPPSSMNASGRPAISRFRWGEG
jgi:hypothetical protein